MKQPDLYKRYLLSSHLFFIKDGKFALCEILDGKNFINLSHIFRMEGVMHGYAFFVDVH